MVKIILLAVCLLSTSLADAQANGKQKEYNLGKASLAISGYDPVAYFTQNKAVKGNNKIAVLFEGVLYHFSSLQNKQTFLAKPAAYEPQYGGWCAYAMGANGEKVDIDPETFKILNGRLYLFYNRLFTNTLKSWNKDETSLQSKADANWKGIFHKTDRL